MYAYVGGNPVGNVDPSGLKYRVCRRPLEGTPGQLGPLRHEYLQFDTGETYSFAPAPGESARHGISSNKLESGNGATCSAYSANSNDDARIKHRAEKNLSKFYELFNYNCQDFVIDSIGDVIGNK